jgi:hypothetical protein
MLPVTVTKINVTGNLATLSTTLLTSCSFRMRVRGESKLSFFLGESERKRGKEVVVRILPLGEERDS